MRLVWGLVAALVLAAVHVFGGVLHLGGTRRYSRWLSFAGGVAIAYVFMHLLPELSAGQEAVRRVDWAAPAFLEHHVYLVSLAGLATFYGMERLVRRHRQQKADHEPTGLAVYHLHVGAFAVYNALIGYVLLHRPRPSLLGLLWFTLAMLLHLFVMDYSLRKDHRHAYAAGGRWVLAGALLAGWLLGALLPLSRPAASLLVAFVAGGIILNVLKEELPEERESRYGAFLVGATTYTGLLLLL